MRHDAFNNTDGKCERDREGTYTARGVATYCDEWGCLGAVSIYGLKTCGANILRQTLAQLIKNLAKL